MPTRLIFVEGDMSDAVLEKKVLINGEWVESESGERYEVISPGDGSVVGTVPMCTRLDARRAVDAAQAAFGELKKMSLLARIALLRKAEEIAQAWDAESVRVTCRESGKPWSQSVSESSTRNGYSWSNFHVATANVKSFRGLTLPNVTEDSNNKRIFQNWEPAGVSVNLSTYSYPSEMPNCTLPYGLALGCPCIIKPSRQTPFSAIMLAEAVHQAGFPAGSVQVLTGEGKEVGAELVSNPGVAHVTLFGQEETGAAIAAQAGFKKQLMAIVSNNPLIVMNDANIDEAIESAMIGVFGHNGQSPISTRRILLHQDVYDAFRDKFKARVQALNMTDPMDPKCDIGPLATRANLDMAVGHIEDARQKGAKVTLGGANPHGLYLEPTIVERVSPDMLLTSEPTPGPVVPLMSFASLDEAIEMANSTRFGFQAGAFTSNLKTAFRISEEIEAGSIYINEATSCWDEMSPFGGAKRSGQGRMLSNWIFQELSRIKVTLIDLGKTAD